MNRAYSLPGTIFCTLLILTYLILRMIQWRSCGNISILYMKHSEIKEFVQLYMYILAPTFQPKWPGPAMLSPLLSLPLTGVLLSFPPSLLSVPLWLQCHLTIIKWADETEVPVLKAIAPFRQFMCLWSQLGLFPSAFMNSVTSQPTASRYRLFSLGGTR